MKVSLAAGGTITTGASNPVEVAVNEMATPAAENDEEIADRRPCASAVTVTGTVVGSPEPAALALPWGTTIWSSVIVDPARFAVEVTVTSGCRDGWVVAQAKAAGTSAIATPSLFQSAVAGPATAMVWLETETHDLPPVSTPSPGAST